MKILIDVETKELFGCVHYGEEKCIGCWWDKPQHQFEPCDGKKAYMTLMYELTTKNKIDKNYLNRTALVCPNCNNHFGCSYPIVPQGIVYTYCDMCMNNCDVKNMHSKIANFKCVICNNINTYED